MLKDMQCSGYTVGQMRKIAANWEFLCTVDRDEFEEHPQQAVRVGVFFYILLNISPLPKSY